ncbi:hypothetical protein AAFX91_31770 [Bradyrhizobium sp. 31Argb]|uniref:hypothetical protein n=1 Tax=unclassified Bradyrhizobium TaxID=2631580 RepID=UPI00102E2307|nr:hypothetical protein [Bradyrhizobium sp. Arg237L]MDI4234329.1 hypothetical protein [Bradyrhizobium sp. Arg237L]TAI63432.1 hypothetical protein CWO89_24245 [Bradyrhizobium sp. Leo170]
MKGWIGAALVAGVMVLASPASVTTAAAGPQRTVAQKADAGATDFSARRYRPYYRNVDRSYIDFYYRPYPPYSRAYTQPYYFRPYPYDRPVPYAFGFRHDPWWW